MLPLKVPEKRFYHLGEDVDPMDVWPASYREFFDQGLILAKDMREPSTLEGLSLKALEASTIFPTTTQVERGKIVRKPRTQAKGGARTKRIKGGEEATDSSMVTVSASLPIRIFINLTAATGVTLLGQMHAEWFVDHPEAFPSELQEHLFTPVLFPGTLWVSEAEMEWPFIPYLYRSSPKARPTLHLMESREALAVSMLATLTVRDT